ncbi:hAT dimerisation domain-containing protein / transposase-related [Striga hermonthica]|uniref:HAT dimerisation domain-containing protein / transposase-related n=1 Tax=Striga hermonthica TaxID=68872 RepID=A0A9N7NZJ0_STRHE|nr:hAT dimerisation domain-containing protein / transposase-related [Striga hermonthica]
MVEGIGEYGRGYKPPSMHELRTRLLKSEHTNGKELLRLAVTRFATAFLTLQSMYKQKRPLEIMFASEEWVSSPQDKKGEGKLIKRIVINDPDFLPHVAFCVKSTVPLVSVLREVDSEKRPAM